MVSRTLLSLNLLYFLISTELVSTIRYHTFLLIFAYRIGEFLLSRTGSDLCFNGTETTDNSCPLCLGHSFSPYGRDGNYSDSLRTCIEDRKFWDLQK